MSTGVLNMEAPDELTTDKEPWLFKIAEHPVLPCVSDDHNGVVSPAIFEIPYLVELISSFDTAQYP